jgi:hypothetical protein
MLKHRLEIKKLISNNKGQVALFVALIFQVLFVFFAMVINVGLLVHHKINLQNSVDLAAYYGATKQAENLNAIAHMNYQIRQSWKLLAWRYRMLGSAGDYVSHPYKKYPPHHLEVGEAQEYVDPNPNTPLHNLQEAPGFCITYVPMKPMPPGENTCKDVGNLSGISLFSTPRIVGFLGISTTVAAASTLARSRAIQRCQDFGSMNYFMLGTFVVAFNMDQSDRMSIINELSSSMSKNMDDFIDLDGESVRKGIKQTLENNLTAPNKDSLKEAAFKVYNSLGNPKCGTTNDKNRPVKWLSPIKIAPAFNYIDTECIDNGDAGGNIGPRPKELTNDPAQLPMHKNLTVYSGAIDQIKDYIGIRDPFSSIYNYSVGVEKNPWCVAYLGVAAETTPNIPFSPFGTVTLKARAFAKPFGGRIGPWHKESWSRRELDDQFSDGGKTVDALIPPRFTDPGSLAQVNTFQNQVIRAANYSRYVGDPYGLKSAKMIGYYGRAIYEMDEAWNNGTLSQTSGAAESVYQGSTAPNFDDWKNLPFDYREYNGTGDILAWDYALDRPSRMRVLEMSAVAPNAFDVAYYSIEPDFFHNYYTRMRDGFISKVAGGLKKKFRPDIGYHKGFRLGGISYDEYSVKEQVKEITTPDAESIMPIKEHLPFTIDLWSHVLTGWMGQSLSDYSMNLQTFGVCTAEPEPGVPNPGNCVVGGSTGYSVKLISSDYLNSAELNLGGANAAKGPLLNPPPDDF